MATEFDAFLFQQPTNQDTIDSDDPYYTTYFSQKLQDIENHLLGLETNPSSSSPLPQSPFFLNLCNSRPLFLQADTTFNDYEFGPIPPSNGLSPPDSNGDNFYNLMAPEMIINHPCEVDVSRNQVDDEEDEAEDGSEDPKPGAMNCKNLVSERNRRKRLSQQLLSLRALVPNITKMDKRSILVDALSYLRSIHEETEVLQKKFREHQHPPSSQDYLGLSSTSAPVAKAHIIEIDTEKIEEKRYAVKVACRGDARVGGDVLRVFEALDFEITYTALQHLQPQEVLVTVFIRVKKQGKMTENKLKDNITRMALKAGLSLYNP